MVLSQQQKSNEDRAGSILTGHSEHSHSKHEEDAEASEVGARDGDQRSLVTTPTVSPLAPGGSSAQARCLPVTGLPPQLTDRSAGSNLPLQL